jgi:hypothetical protein
MSGVVCWNVFSRLTKLAAGVALHSLGLAVTGKVVRSTALVASGQASATSETATETSSIAATRRTASSTTHSRVGAVAGKMASDTAAVAASAGAGSTQTQSWAVSLNVSETLAVVALLGCSLVSSLLLYHAGLYIAESARGPLGESSM